MAKKAVTKRKPNAAFMRPVTPDAALSEVVGAKPRFVIASGALHIDHDSRSSAIGHAIDEDVDDQIGRPGCLKGFLARCLRSKDQACQQEDS